MSFISDFLEYNSGTETPKNYLRWSALVALGVAASPRYIFMQGRKIVTTNMSVVLIGEQGNRKSYPMSQVKDMIRETFTDPPYPFSAAMQSREKIVELMASPDARRIFVDHNGASNIYTPMAFFINELKNFLSFNPAGMIEFITDIWGERVFNASTIKRGTENIELPCLNFLACETPDWIIDKLKMKILGGGFSRRFIFVYEMPQTDLIIPEPFLPPNEKQLWERMKAKLVYIHSNAREYKWADSTARTYFHQWYRENKLNVPSDPMLRGFKSTKDQHVIRVAILLDLAEDTPEYVITQHHIEVSLAFFEAIECNIPKLSVASGRNELAAPQAKLIELIESRGGLIPFKKLMAETESNLSPMEQLSVLRHLTDTDRLIRKTLKVGDDTIAREWVFTKAYYDEAKLKGEITEVERPMR